jgi:hypothetical protein
MVQIAARNPLCFVWFTGQIAKSRSIYCHSRLRRLLIGKVIERNEKSVKMQMISDLKNSDERGRRNHLKAWRTV